MRKIAITQRLILNESYQEIREALDINYAKLIRDAGFIPIIIPYEVNFLDYANNIGIDGVLFTGGNDLFICKQNELSRKRDNFEKAILSYCIKNKIPVIGLCRGMQLIASYFGSTIKTIDNHVNARHKLSITNSSQYYSYLKTYSSVNSYHNFSIDKLADGLIVSATSEDNNIEAIEHIEYKIFGQMWHSERELPFIESDIKFIREFFKG